MSRGAHSSEAGLAGWRACYGVDLQGDRCTAVRAERVRGRVVCTAVDAAAIERLAAEGRPVVSVMSERESFTRWVEAPYRSAAKARRVFPTLLDIQLPFALDDCLHTLIAIERSPQGACRGLAAAARRTHVQAKLAACEARGCDPVVLDQAGLALWTQAGRECPPADADAARTVAWLDDTHATLVKGRGHAFISAHAVPVDDVDRLRHLAAPPDATPDATPTEWLWCGPAATPERVHALWQALGQPGTPRTVDDPAAFLVRAIATRALLAGPYRCNLRTGDLTHATLRRRDRRRGRRAVGLALGAALLLAAADGAALWLMKTRRDAVEAAVSAEIDALAGYHVTARGRDALRAVQDAIQERKNEQAAFVAAVAPSLLGDLVAIMETARDHGLRIDALALSPGQVEVSGTSPGWKQCEALLPVLSGTGPRPELKRGEALANERIPFSLTKGGTP